MAGPPASSSPATPRKAPFSRRSLATAVALASAAAYSWFAATTTPFTIDADVTTAVPIVAMVVVYLLQRAHPDGPWRRIPADRPPAGGTPVPWVTLVLLLVVSEVASLFAGPRATHPTLSSLADTIFHWHAAKAAVYFVWLGLSWYFLRR